MKRHIMAMTYEPKIEAVRSGECRQTIRKGRKVSAGDEILFHGWSGKPYRSKWNWRKRVVVNHVACVKVKADGISFGYWPDPLDEERDGFCYPDNTCYAFAPWESHLITKLALDDYIFPPTGVVLRDVLFQMNGISKQPEEYQIIRW